MKRLGVLSLQDLNEKALDCYLSLFKETLTSQEIGAILALRSLDEKGEAALFEAQDPLLEEELV